MSADTTYIVNNAHCNRIEKILIVEDSLLLLNAIKEKLNEEFDIVCDTASNEKEAMELLEKNSYDLLIADIYLPDSTGNFIGYLIRKKNRIIIITASDDDEKRAKLVSLPIVDYIYKTDQKSTLSYIVQSLKRLHENENSTILICDDSQLSRLQIRQLIVQQNLPYIDVKDGQEAYNCIVKEKVKIDLLITDVYMPKMNGIELIRYLRHEYPTNELPILALSASEKISLVAKLLKTGANDYISKPINNEEFLTRLNISLDQTRLYRENQKLIKELKTMANTDYLTQLYNRSYFYTAVELIQVQAKRHKQPYGILLLDIDHFKDVNDTYGHDAGDSALKGFASILRDTARESDIICRWGGEEFLILIPNTNEKELIDFAQRIRKIAEESDVTYEINKDVLEFNITVSVGVAISNDSNVLDVESIIYKADNRLYKAKESGRNRVIYR